MLETPIVSSNERGDIFYVKLSDAPVCRTREFGDDRLLDYDADDNIVGAEFIVIDDAIDLSNLPDSTLFSGLLLASLPSEVSVIGTPSIRLAD